MSEMSTGAAIQMQLDSWRGYSAYEIAVKNGFEGTEAEWLESLKGEPGAEMDTVTVNNKGAVDGNITIRATDIYVEAGLATTVAQALERCVNTDNIVEGLDCAEEGKVLAASQGKALADMVALRAQVLRRQAILPAAAWEQDGEIYGQSVEVAGVTADADETTVIAAPPVDRAMEGEYIGCEVRASAQGDGVVVFTCTDLPDEDLMVNMMVVIHGTAQNAGEGETE